MRISRVTDNFIFICPPSCSQWNSSSRQVQTRIAAQSFQIIMVQQFPHSQRSWGSKQNLSLVERCCAFVIFLRATVVHDSHPAQRQRVSGAHYLDRLGVAVASPAYAMGDRFSAYEENTAGNDKKQKKRELQHRNCRAGPLASLFFSFSFYFEQFSKGKISWGSGRQDCFYEQCIEIASKLSIKPCF